MVRPDEIVRFDDAPAPPGETPWVGEREPLTAIEVVDPDPAWPDAFDVVARRIRAALGDAVLSVEHVGSTAVPGLPAKPVIDVDLTVPDSTDEEAYLPRLVSAGFVLRVREPWWYEHRMLVSGEPRANVHVWSPHTPEPARHLIFRDWLRANPDDRDLYRDAKRAAAEESTAHGERVTQYNERKQAVIRAIYARALRAAGLAP